MVFTFFLRLLVIAILVFITTPTALLQWVKDNLTLDPAGLIVQTVGNLNPRLDFYVRDFLPPLIVLVVNRLLLLIVFRLSDLTSPPRNQLPLLLLPHQHSGPGLRLRALQHADRSRLGHSYWLLLLFPRFCRAFKNPFPPF